MNYMLRTLVGCAALAVGTWAATGAAPETPDLPADSYKKAADADLKFLKTKLGELAAKKAAGDEIRAGQSNPALGVALLLAAYADVLGDAALKTDSLKVAAAINDKDFKGAEDLAKKITVKVGKGKPAALPKPDGLSSEALLLAIMNPTRTSSAGGLNIEKDIRDLGKMAGGAKLDPAAVEILGVRSAVINSYGFHHPNEKAKTNDANKKLWEKLSGEAVDLSKQIATEAAKGAKADEKTLRTKIGLLNRSCMECHDKLRD